MSHEAYDRVGPFYLQYYRTQRGRGETSASSPRVFRGAERWRMRQHGDGFGSLLRGLARFLLPVVGRGIGAFASHTLDASERGASLGEAAKSALKPTLRAVIDAGAGQISKQGGNGDKKRHATESSDFYERMQEAKRRKHKRRQSGLGKKRQHHHKSSSEGFFERMQEAKQSGRGKIKTKKKQSGKKQRGGGGSKKRKVRVYKTDPSSNF